MPLILVTSCTPQAAHTRGRRARPACIPGSQQHELPSPLAFLCDGSFGVAPVLLLAQFPQRQGGAPKVFLETSYSVQTEGRGGGFQGGDQAEPGPPPPLWPQGGRWALSRVAAGPSAGSSQHSLRPRGLRESGASASCGFSTWWWPAPGRMQEESPPPCPGCSLHLALTSFPGANKDVPNLWAGRGCASSPAAAAHRWTRPLQQLLSQALAFHLGNAEGGISPSVAAPFCSQDCSCAQELLSPAGTPLSFPRSPGILRSLRSSV